MQLNDMYSIAHLFVAAVRVLEFQHSTPPTLEDVCGTLSMSMERGGFICKQLQDLEVVESVEGNYGRRIFIKDHLKIENIPKGKNVNRLENELSKFKESQKKFAREIESFKAEQDKKKKDRFADIEKKLKEQLEKK